MWGEPIEITQLADYLQHNYEDLRPIAKGFVKEPDTVAQAYFLNEESRKKRILGLDGQMVYWNQ